jgi:hypothetical protein
MSRALRLSTFFFNAILLGIAVGVAITCYLVSLGFSPFGYAPLFPRDTLLIPLAVLAGLSLATGIVGCSGSYKKAFIPLALYAIFLSGIMAGQIVLGKVTFDIPNLTEDQTRGIWNNLTPEQRISVSDSIRCCGFLDITPRENCSPFAIRTCDVQLVREHSYQVRKLAIFFWAASAFSFFPMVSSILFAIRVYKTDKKARRVNRLLGSQGEAYAVY